MGWLISRQQFQALMADAEPIAWGGKHVKVLRSSNGELVKLFRMKTKPSSDWLYPYSLRFVRHAHRLIDLGIPCVEVLHLHFAPSERMHLVIYKALPGKPLNQLYLQDHLQALGKFIALLHHRGIYFRSLHLGNVLRMPDGRLGLIDVADMRIDSGPLRPHSRIRNLKHLIRRKDNREQYGWAGFHELLQIYLKQTETLGDANLKLHNEIAQFEKELKGQFLAI